VGLIGPSGCGKYTTVRLLLGLLAPSTGTARVWGTEATHLSSSQRQRIGYLPQLPALFPDLSLWENLSFHASMYGLRLRRRHRLHHVLEWVELDEHRKKRVRQVSGGMRRRLALAAAFVHDPALVFLDEPTAGIDPILRQAFWEQFRQMRDEGRTLCVTTQYVGEAAYCDYVGLLSDGELLLLDTPENLRAAAFDGNVVEVELAREVEPAMLASLAELVGARAEPEHVSVRTWQLVVPDSEAAIERIGAELPRPELPIVEVRPHVVDFDEAFVRLIERHRAGVDAAAPAMAARPGGGRAEDRA
jgi:ABC-2 type transport system ATP-binding protein